MPPEFLGYDEICGNNGRQGSVEDALLLRLPYVYLQMYVHDENPSVGFPGRLKSNATLAYAAKNCPRSESL
jgi:hypothetical protein